MHIYLMRHGRSLADDEQRFEGLYDAPLTEVGKEQARKRAEFFMEHQIFFDRIIASNLRRAAETGEIVAETLGSPLQFDSIWCERDNGVLAGLPYSQAATKYPRPDFRSRFTRFPENSGESGWELHSRAIKALHSVIDSGLDRLLIISHGNIINAVLRIIVGTPPAINYKHGIFFFLGDCGVVSAEFICDEEKWIISSLYPGPHMGV